MGLIEVEIVKPKAAALVRAMLARLGTPLPTIPTLGSDRLIDQILWLEDLSLDEQPAELQLAPGTLAVRCPISIRHLSIAELAADASAAPQATAAVAWVSIGATPSGLALHLLRIDVEGTIPQWYFPPKPLTSPGLPLSGVSPVKGTILASASYVTLRFGTSPSDVLAGPPADRIAQGVAEWLIRVSGEAIAESFVRQLAEGIGTLGTEYELEEAPTAAWAPRADATWGVSATMGVVARDACLGVDVSVALEIDGKLVPSAETGKLTLDVELRTDVSDWDTFRCWMSVGALGGALLAGIAAPPFLGELALVGSLIAIPMLTELQALDGIQELGSTPGLEKVADTDDGALYRSVSDLPALPNLTDEAAVTADGLIVQGRSLAGVLPHERTFHPSVIAGSWTTRVDCGQRFVEARAVLPEITVSDEHAQERLPVRVFDTSVVAPAHAWRLRWSPFPSVAPRVRVEAIADPPETTGSVFLHTSAGLRRIDIGFTDPVPELGEVEIEGLLATCHRFALQWAPFMELLWRPDPPPFSVFDPLRHWMIMVEQMHEGETLRIRQIREGVALDQEVVLSRQGDGAVAVELVTDKGTILTLEHDGPARPAIRMVQRWLLPQHAVALPGAALGLQRRGDAVEVALGDGVFGVSAATGRTSFTPRSGPLEAPPPGAIPLDGRTVTLREHVAAAFDGQLWLCAPLEAAAETNIVEP